MPTEYYTVRWKDPRDGVWHDSCLNSENTLARAEEQLKRDKAYFYSDIQIVLVKISEVVEQTVYGVNQRPKPTGQE